MDPRITRVRDKLSLLRAKDSGHEIFGSSSHQYRLRPVTTAAQLDAFEEKHAIKLPEDYRIFLMQIGNGGAGPYYGLVPFEQGLLDDLDYPDNGRLVNLSAPFELENAWNIDLGDVEEDEDAFLEKREKEYSDPKWSNGLLKISNFGCGVFINLVVNGNQWGIVWVDDRCNDGGIYPDHYFGNKERIGFLEWYELWLDKSLEEIGAVYDPAKNNKNWFQKLFSK